MLRRTLKEIGWALTYVALAALCFHGGVAVSQNEDDSNIVRAYHLDRSGIGSSNLCDTSIGCPTIGIWFQQAVGATLTPDIGPGYVMNVVGNPTRVPGATWPAGFSASPGYAWRMDGTGDYLSIADDPAFESQDFSVFVCFIPRVRTASDIHVAKYASAGGQRSWIMYSAAIDRVTLGVSDDGTADAGHFSVVQRTGALSPNKLTCYTGSYKWVGDGTSIGNVWVDELSVATSNIMDGPPFNSNVPLTIGADGAGIGGIPADIYVVAYYPGVLTAADHAKLNRRFRGLYDGSLSTVVTYSAATPPALQVAAPSDGVSPFLVDQPANSGMLGKTASCVGVYGSSAVTNLVQRSSFETWAAGAATGWVETPTDTGDATQNTTLFAHGSSSVQLSTTDADDAIVIKGACLTVADNPTLVYSFSWYDYLVSGAGSLDVSIYEDDTADCSSPTGHMLIGVVPILNTWSKRTTPYSTQAGTIRVQTWIALPAAAAQETVVDAVQLRLGGATDAYCDQNVDASSVCTTSLPSHPSALSANGAKTIEATWCTPWAGTEVAATTFMWSDGAAVGGSPNTFGIAIPATTDELYAILYDAASGGKGNAPNTANWAANTPYTVRWYMSGLGAVGITWPVGTWFTALIGAGTGIRSAAQTTTYLCGSHTAGSDCWITGETTYRGWMQ